MEPIRLWRVRDQLGALSWITALPAVHEQAWRDLIESEWVASPRADFDALVKRDRTCPLCGDELDPDEVATKIDAALRGTKGGHRG